MVVKYVYDAWGNNIALDINGNEVTSGIGILNPFRYRGYYYDIETELYYLQTRYYDPEICRFISQDSLEYADSETINGLNLYAYCKNNPINNCDPAGNWSLRKFFKKVAMAVAAVAVVVAVTALVVVTAGAAAVALGASAAVTTAVMAGAAVGGVVAGTVNIATQAAEKGIENINIGSVATSTFGGAIVGAAVAGGAAVAAGGSAGAASLALANGGSVTVSGISVLAKAGLLGLNIVFSQIDYHGTPNSFVQNGGSFGQYYENGNLMYRTDTDHLHFIKEIQQYFQPHTHHFKWDFIKGAWRIIGRWVTP